MIPGCHLKLSNQWPGENPPSVSAGRLHGVLAFRTAAGGFLELPALALELEPARAIHQAVEHAGDEYDVAKYGTMRAPTQVWREGWFRCVSKA